MITLLRKIRRRLLGEGKLASYFIYAFGEILLVVVGILIALQVNNWNEDRKEKKSELKTLIDLNEEFRLNKSTFGPHLTEKQVLREKWNTFIEHIADPEVPDAAKSMHRLQSGSTTYNPSQSTLNSVLETGKINVIGNDSLRYLLSNWNDLLSDFFEDEQWHIDFIHKELYPYETKIIPSHFDKTFIGDAYISPFHSSKEMKQYFRLGLKDPIYRNLLLRNYQYLTGSIMEGERVVEMMDLILELLQQEIDNQ